jgi:hypothetical protein
MQDNTTYPGIAKTLEHVSELTDYLSSFLQNADEDGLTLDEIERLHLYLKTADLITIEPMSNKSFEQNWEQIKAEASQIESDRAAEEEEEALRAAELRAQDERDYWQQTAASLAR